MRLWAAGLLVAASPAWAAGGDAAKGEVLFQRHCYACHSVDPAETGLPGPNLFKVIGRQAASRPEFDYSPAMRSAGAGGLRWTEAKVNQLIADPSTYLPGTEMTFPGLDKPAERADIVAFLRRSARNP